MQNSASEGAIAQPSLREETKGLNHESSMEGAGALGLADSTSSNMFRAALNESGSSNSLDATLNFTSDPQTASGGLAEVESSRRYTSHLSKLRHRSGSHGKKEQESERDLREVESHRGSGGGAPLGRKRRGRINLAIRRLAPSYRSKNEAFRRLFRHEISEDERLIDDYSCALQRDVLVHGRMYVSQNYLCFYANIFGFETLIVLNFSDVAAVTREKTALVIPNALQITMNEPVSKPKYYFFASFISRDTSYMVLFKIWQNVLMGSPMSPEHLRTFACRCWGQKSDVNTNVEALPSLTRHSPNEDERSRDDQSSKSEAEDELEKHEDDLDDHSDADENEDGDEGSDREIECGCPVHDEPVFLDQVYNISVKALFQLLFTPSGFYRSFMDRRKMFDLVIDPWSDVDAEDATAGKKRDVHFTVTVKGGLGPRFAPSVESQHLLGDSRPKYVYRVEAESTNSGVPYGDAFYTFIRYCITRVGRNSARLRIGACVKYRKKVFSMIRSMIERAAVDGMGEHYQEMNASILDETHRYEKDPSSTSALKEGDHAVGDELKPAEKPTEHDEGRKERTPDIMQRKPRRDRASVLFVATSSLGSLASWLFRRWAIILCAIMVASLVANFLLFFQQRDTSMPFDTVSGKTVCRSTNPWLELLRMQNEYHRKELTEWRNVVINHTQTMAKVVDILQRLVREKEGVNVNS